MTRIVYVAPFQHSWGTEDHLARDAERIPGVTVERVREPGPDVPCGQWWADLIQRADNADLVLYTKGRGLPSIPDDPGRGWRAIEATGTQTASQHLDLYWGLAREREIGVDPFWYAGTVFTADGDPTSAEKFAALGINHHWFPPACVSDEIEPGRPRSAVLPVTFVGSRRYHPEHPWRTTLLDGLGRRYGSAFHPYTEGPRIHGETLSDLYRASGVVVGDSLCLPNHTRYCSDRLPEVLGRGGFLIFPRIEGIAERFGLVSGEHLRFYDYGDLDGLFGLIDYYLAHPDEARAMAARGQAHIGATATYTIRAAEMLTVLGLQ